MGLERANINFSFAKPAIDDAIKNISGGRTYNFVPSANEIRNSSVENSGNLVGSGKVQSNLDVNLETVDLGDTIPLSSTTMDSVGSNNMERIEYHPNLPTGDFVPMKADTMRSAWENHGADNSSSSIPVSLDMPTGGFVPMDSNAMRHSWENHDTGNSSSPVSVSLDMPTGDFPPMEVETMRSAWRNVDSEKSEMNSSGKSFENWTAQDVTNQVNDNTVDSGDSYFIVVDALAGMEVEVKEIHQFDEHVLDFTGIDGNTYHLEYVDGEWQLTSLTNIYGDSYDTSNENFQKILSELGDSGVTINNIVFSQNADMMMIFTDVGTLHFNYDCSNCKNIINGDVDYFSTQDIYSDLNMLSQQYGGNQNYLFGNCADFILDEKVQEIVAKYYPEAAGDISLLPFLFYRMNKVGCGYVAAVNTIFDHYSDLSNEEWESIFGFPKISTTDLNYTYNYPYLLLEYFLFYQKDFAGFNTLEEVIGNAAEQMVHCSSVDSALSNDSFEVTGAKGTYQTDVTEEMEKFVSQFGLSLSTTVATSEEIDAYTPEVIQTLLDSNKQLVISCNHFNLYSPTDENGDGQLNDLAASNVGSHAMAITGTTDDGRLIVSSWGRQYILDPHEKVETNDVGQTITTQGGCASHLGVYSYS